MPSERASLGGMTDAIVIMGVSGVGKSTIGQAVAEVLGLPFVEADDFHTEGSIARMERGEPLGDAERDPWMRRVRAAVLAAGPTVVVACSALRDRQRMLLAGGLDRVRWVLLDAEPEVVRRRLADRGRGVGPALLDSQLADLEAPPDALVVDASRSPAEVVQFVVDRLRC